ncbi:GntR family transcriptional regulator [Nocardia sp. CA-135953]|uniref:GntR family transcriptional regulator n=1 Tax=Nocardia sp. CA-135953 TaxID=3239978 RepID=UPI003D9966D8
MSTRKGQWLTESELAPSRKEVVLRTLRGEILSGALAPGHPIKDVELAARLEVSITPVREAVTQLIEEGLIEALPNKRRRVTTLSLEAATELMDVLGVLLCATLQRALPNLPGEPLARLRAAVDEYRPASRARDKHVTRSAMDDFVHILTAAAANRELANLVDGVATRSYRLIGLDDASPLWVVWRESLDAVVELLEAGRGLRAVIRLEDHFATVVATLREHGDSAGVLLGPTG